MPSLNSLTVTVNRSLVYGAQGSGGSQVQFINLSTSTSIYLGYDSTLNASQASSNIPLGPGASITLDGLISVYALTGVGSAQLAVVPGGVDYSPSVGINNLLSLGTLNGAGYISLPASSAAITILSNQQDVSAYNTITISAYASSANTAAAGSTCTIPFTITWYDDLTSGIPVFQDEVDIWVANNVPNPPASLAGVAYWSMPVRGKYLSIWVSNPGTASAIDLQFFNMFGGPQFTPRVYCKQIPPPSLAWTNATYVGNYFSTLSGILGSATYNQAETTSLACPMGLFTGQGSLYCLTSAAMTNDVSLFTMIPRASNTTLPTSNPIGVLDDDLDGADDTNDQDSPIALPKCPTLIYFINDTAGSVVVNVCLTAMDQA